MTAGECSAANRRLLELLKKQEAQFQLLVSVLQQQSSAITDHDLPLLEDRITAETELILKLEAYERVILPLRRLTSGCVEEATSELKQVLIHAEQDVAELRQQCKSLQATNRELLSAEMEEVSRRRRENQVPKRPARVFENGNTAGGLLDMRC